MGRLNEWKAMTQPASITAPKSNKEKFTDLVNYFKTHKSTYVTNTEVINLENTGFEYKEHREVPSINTEYDLVVTVDCSKFNYLFKIHIDKDGKRIENSMASGWEELVRFLKVYFPTPNIGTPEYDSLTENCSIADDFKLYENLWDELTENFLSSYIRKIGGKKYDLTKESDLRAAMKAVNDPQKACWMKDLIRNGEVGQFSEGTRDMALRVWTEYQDNLKK